MSGAAPRYLKVCHAPDPRGLLLGIYISAVLWAGLGLAVSVVGQALG